MKNPLSRFFIKDRNNNNHMANDNNSNNNKNNTNNTNPAAADGETQSSNGAPNSRKVVAVDTRGNPVNTGDVELKKQVQPQQGQQATTTTTTAAAAVGGGQVQAPKSGQGNDDGDLDIDKLISESTKEIKTGDEAQEAKQKKHELLTKAINSRIYIEPITFRNTETDEQVGTKMRYTKDGDGKTIYDYMNDPEVTAHIGFKVSESDPQDGSPVDEQISIYWVNPVY